MKRNRTKFNQYFFTSGRQLFGLVDRTECSDVNKIIATGIATTPFANEFTIDKVKCPIYKKYVIERSNEPIIEEYIIACETKNKDMHEKTMHELREKYFYPTLNNK